MCYIWNDCIYTRMPHIDICPDQQQHEIVAPPLLLSFHSHQLYLMAIVHHPVYHILLFHTKCSLMSECTEHLYVPCMWWTICKRIISHFNAWGSDDYDHTMSNLKRIQTHSCPRIWELLFGFAIGFYVVNEKNAKFFLLNLTRNVVYSKLRW